MTVKELMERAGLNQTGRAIAYIKDGLEEIQMLTEVHTKVERIDLEKDKRFYTLPNEMIKMLDIRVKNHLNSRDEYRSIPRMINKPVVKDGDAV
ncbi:MAG: hypothetical protein Unbinned3338contig1000_11 [Prokaryotic dsDNA virus sp.]|nr:MAG: hypothetical protein Unbinned3338contig1000_11 [Prokaryotic dsDNA virus sp.]|tara:strand:+ start:2775 stop:3056 length:282 start_codon:yes stop_codon:yes gene_type:complete